MPVRTIAGTDLAYALVVFDEKGDERPEADGTFLSETLAQRVADPARPVTDVFFTANDNVTGNEIWAAPKNALPRPSPKVRSSMSRRTSPNGPSAASRPSSWRSAMWPRQGTSPACAPSP